MENRYKLSAVVEREGKGYVSHCVDVGVSSQGDTIDEALANLKEAVELWLKHAESDQLEELSKNKHEEPLLATISVSGG